MYHPGIQVDVYITTTAASQMLCAPMTCREINMHLKKRYQSNIYTVLAYLSTLMASISFYSGTALAQSEIKTCLRYTRYSVYVSESSNSLTHSGDSCGQNESFTLISKTGADIVDGSEVYIRNNSGKWWRINGRVVEPVFNANHRSSFVVDRVFPRPWGPGTAVAIDMYIQIKASLSYEAKAILKSRSGTTLRWDVNLENEEAATFQLERSASPGQSCSVVQPTADIGVQNQGVQNLPICNRIDGHQCNPNIGIISCRRGNYEQRICDCLCGSDLIYKYDCN